MTCAPAPVTTPPRSHPETSLGKAADGWRISIHHDHRQLEEKWRQLEGAGCCTVFQTFDWVACWYDVFTAHGATEPVIVLVTDANDQPVWLLPLCRFRKKGLRFITFADLGVTDYAAPVMAPDAPSDPRIVRALLKTVVDALPPCDVVHFQKITNQVEGMPNPLLAADGVTRFPMDCHGIRLTEDWPTLASRIMQSRLRSAIRRQKNKLRSVGDISLEHLAVPEMLGPVLDRLLAMRKARFAAIGRADMPPSWRAFYHSLATRPDRTLDVSVTTMMVSGEPIATCFGLARNKAYHAILPTFALGTWESFKPGMLLFDAILTDHAAKSEGQGYFDFTIGDEPYKKRFGSECNFLFQWLAPRSAAGFIACAAWRLKNAWHRRRGQGVTAALEQSD